MPSKLTLSIDKNVADSAKRYAQKKGESLSGIVESYFKLITTQEEQDNGISEKVASMMGVIKLPDDYDYKKNLSDAVANKEK